MAGTQSDWLETYLKFILIGGLENECRQMPFHDIKVRNYGAVLLIFTVKKSCDTKIITFQIFRFKKDVNRDFHIASSSISQSSFFKEVRCLILASSQRKLPGYIEFL